MSSASVTTTDEDGHVVITRSDDGATVMDRSGDAGTLVRDGSVIVGLHSDKPLDGASFVAGLLLGALLYFILQSAMRWHARREAKRLARTVSIGPQEDRMAAEVAALSRRTATLETIVTDPAQRTAREIEALR